VPPDGGLLCGLGVADLRADPWLFYMLITILMPNITKKQLAEQIAASTKTKQTVVKTIIQHLLDAIITELAKDNRIEFRDFGVFETRT